MILAVSKIARSLYSEDGASDRRSIEPLAERVQVSVVVVGAAFGSVGRHPQIAVEPKKGDRRVVDILCEDSSVFRRLAGKLAGLQVIQHDHDWRVGSCLVEQVLQQPAPLR